MWFSHETEQDYDETLLFLSMTNIPSARMLQLAFLIIILKTNTLPLWQECSTVNKEGEMKLKQC